MRLLHLSDLHLCSSPNAIIYGVNPYENLLKAIEKTQAIKDNIDFCVITGDISNDGSQESYEFADEVLSAFPFPVYVMRGNHDSPLLITRHYPKMKYSPRFSVKGIDFIVLDTVAIAEDGTNRSRGVISKQELLRFKEWIEEGDNRKIVLMHHPSFLTDSWLDRRILQNREEFNDYVHSSDRIIAVLSGHNHFAMNTMIGGCLYSVAPSVSTSFDKDLPPFEEAYKPGFNLLSISDGGCRVDTLYL